MALAAYVKSLNNRYPNIAYLFAALGYCFQAFLQIAFKYVAGVVPPFYTLFLRALCLFLLNTVFMRRAKETPYIRDPYVFRQMLKRLIFSTSYAVITYYCVKDLPVSTVSTLSNTGPIFIFFIEAFYYNRALNKISLGFTCLSFIGVMLILQPQFLFPNESHRVTQRFEFLSMMVIIAAFCFSMTMIYIHDLAKRISTMVNLHYSYISHMLFTGILSCFQPPHIQLSELTIKIGVAFILVVFFALTAQYMIFIATSLKQPSYTMPLGYLAIIIGLLADIAFFKVEFNLITIIGMLLTSAGLLSKLFLAEEKMKTRSENKSNHPRQEDEIGNYEEEEEDDEIRASRQEQIQRI